MVLVAAALLVAPLLTPADHLTASNNGEVGMIGGSVSRSAFTEAVVNREPKNRVTELLNSKQYIYYFSELKGMAGQRVIHRWLLNGKPMSETAFNIGSPRWRIWSGTALQSDRLGTWTVEVVNDIGQVVHSDSFSYIQNNAIQN
jgi:hypothetical protein